MGGNMKIVLTVTGSQHLNKAAAVYHGLIKLGIEFDLYILDLKGEWSDSALRTIGQLGLISDNIIWRKAEEDLILGW